MSRGKWASRSPRTISAAAAMIAMGPLVVEQAQFEVDPRRLLLDHGPGRAETGAGRSGRRWGNSRWRGRSGRRRGLGGNCHRAQRVVFGAGGGHECTPRDENRGKPAGAITFEKDSNPGRVSIAQPEMVIILDSIKNFSFAKFTAPLQSPPCRNLALLLIIYFRGDARALEPAGQTQPGQDRVHLVDVHRLRRR